MAKMKLMTVVAVAGMAASAAIGQAMDIKALANAYAPAFVYDGVAFEPAKWRPVFSQADEWNGRVEYTSPDGRLALTVDYQGYEGYPVWEMRPVLTCSETAESGIVTDFRSLALTRPCTKNSVRIRRITGSKTRLTDFMHQDATLMPRFGCDTLQMTTDDGTCASTWLPYFGVDFSATDGLEVAVGWTGGWKADMRFQEVPSSPNLFTMACGMEQTNFRMHPRERFQMPRMLVYERKDETVPDAMVRLHRFFIQCKAPRDSSGELFKPLLPLTAGGGNKTDQNMLSVIEKATFAFSAPFDTFWVDANWYGPARELPQRPNCAGDWHLHVGDWRVNTWTHPDGDLSLVSDAARGAGMRFLLWFEPERCVKQAPVMETNPEYFHCVRENPLDFQYLLDLGNDDAWNWAFDMVTRNIDESHVDIYRQDYNMGGRERRIWQEMDAPDRQGVSEIKHINGLWRFWQALHERYPDMLMENCASGGRRMDYVMMSLAHSYCRDDAHMVKNCDELTQNITLTSTPYIPFTGGETFTVPVYDTYAFLSRLGAGTVFTPTDFDGMFIERDPVEKEVKWFDLMLNTAGRVRQYFMGDFYALTDPAANGSDVYCAYQLDDPKSAAGFFAVFRRAECPEEHFHLRLNAIDPAAQYEVESFDGEKTRMTGRALADQLLDFPEKRTCKLIFYKRI